MLYFPTMTANADFAGCAQGHMLQIIRNKLSMTVIITIIGMYEIHAEKFDEWVAEKKRKGEIKMTRPLCRLRE